MSDEMNALIDGFLQSREMDMAADYINRGRVYASSTVEALELGWVRAFSAYVDSGSMTQEMDDFGAELGLRGRGLPVKMAPEAMARMQERLKAMGPPSREAGQAIGGEILQFAKEKAEKAN